MNFQITSWSTGKVLFELETESMKLCVEAAIKQKIDLRSANLSSANLSYADLSSANLSSANLSSADLRSADLRSANLSYADLRYADLRSADLRSADGVIPHITTPLLMLLDQPGAIQAYKLVTEAGWSPIQTTGQIQYEIGKTYRVEKPNRDVNEQCGAGINLATLDWCLKEYRDGYRVFIAEFTAKDIAAIPTATDGKFRCSKVKIVGEVDLVKIGFLKEPAAEKASA